MNRSQREIRAVVWAAVALATVLIPQRAAAQTSSLSIKRMNVGDCQVIVEVAKARPGDQVGVVVELTASREQAVVKDGDLTFRLSEPLREGFRVHTTLNGVAGKDQLVEGKGVPPKGTCEQPSADVDDPFYASVYLGTVIDNFAPDRVGDYRNPEAGTRQKAQWITGFDFDYRLYGNSNSRRRVWIQGETMHGVRTADINCEPRDEHGNVDASRIPPVCNKDAPFADRVRYILENASSIEAFVEPRFEFLQVQKGSGSSAWLYSDVSVGFIGLKDAPKVFRTMHVGLGLLADEGNFDGSFVEFGWGRDELLSNRWNRIHIDGLLSFSLERLPLVRDNGRLFVEMVVDNDPNDGPDVVRTFFGVDVDLRKALGQ